MVNFGDTRLPDRFWDKVSPEPNSGCWFWAGALSGNGYGSLRAGGKGHSAHRYAYTALVGEVDPALDLDHLCRNRACCNPAHLEPVTRSINSQRGDCGKHNTDKTHCPKGHPYSGANLGFNQSKGCRVCRACQNEATRAWYRRNTTETLVVVVAIHPLKHAA